MITRPKPIHAAFVCLALFASPSCSTETDAAPQADASESSAEPTTAAGDSVTTEPPLADSEATETEPAENAGAPAIERGAPLDAPAEGAVPNVDARATDSIRGIETAINSGGLDAGGIQALEDQKAKTTKKGVTAISWMDLSMQDLAMEDILDALLYPDEYEEGEFDFPDRIKKHDEKKISIVGYMIPLEWKETTVPEFMLVRDLMGCCFGGAPQPDEWISVVMVDKGAEYYPYIPVVVTGTFRVEGIEDEAGYASGCFHIDGESVEKDL